MRNRMLWLLAAGLSAVATLPADATSNGGPAAFAFEASLEGQNPPGGVPSDRFGTAVSMDIDSLAVGVPGRFGDDSQEVGSVLLFLRTGGSWNQTQILRAPSDGLDGDRFGAAVSKFGQYVAVGTDPEFGGTRGAYVFESGPDGFVLVAQLLPPAGESAPSFGRSVSIVGSSTTGWLAVGAPESRAVYLYERVAGTWTFRQKLLAGDADANATFGASVEIDHPLDMLAVGSPGQDTPGAADAGAVYVFRRSGSAWTQEAKLAAPNAAAGDALGASVSMWEGTLIAGAPGADAPGAVDRGAAHVFAYASGAWGWQAALEGAAGRAGDGFGSAVSVSYDTAVAGAPGANAGGAAYPFTRAGGVWSAGTPFVSNGTDADDAFGAAVTVFENRAVVGAPDRVEAGPGPTGAAYAFVEAGGSWSEVQPIVPDHGSERMRFAWDLATDGQTVAAGGPGVNVPAARAAGGVFVFHRSAAGWGTPQRLAAADPAEGDELGYSVGLSGDALVAGAFWKNLGPLDAAGAAYVFRRRAGAWSQEQRLVAPDAAAGDYFGYDVALSGDTAIVGAFLEETGPVQATGSAYVFVRTGGVWTFQQKLTASDPTFDAGFGVSVAVAGDTIAVGAHGDQSARGAVYVFRRSGGTWAEAAKLQAPDGVASSFFGYSVAIDAARIAVGAPETDAVGANSGAVYTFVDGPAGFAFEQKLVPVTAAAAGDVGHAVALAGSRLVTNGIAGGTEVVHVFERTGGSWTQLPDLVAPDGRVGFGRSVATAGSIVVGGNPLDASPGLVGGIAHVFRKAQADLTASIDDGQAAAVPGATVTYAIVARNAGPDPVVGARVTTPAPVPLTDVAWTCTPSPGASCGAGGTGVLDDLASLPAGASATYAFTGTIPPGVTGTLTTSARVAAPIGVLDPNAANDIAQDVDLLTVRTDLALVLTSLPTAVGSGALVTWATEVTNLGPSTSTGSVLVHDLAAHATVVSVDPPPPTCVPNSANVTCAFGVAEPGAARRLTFVQRVDAGYLGPIAAQSTVTASETDPVAANNHRQLEVQVIPPGDAEVGHGTSLLVSMAPGGAGYRISQTPFSSYEAIVDATSGDIGGPDGPVLTLASVTSTVVTGTAVGTGSSRTLRWRNDAPAVVDDQYIRVVSGSCTTDCGPEDVYRLRVYETTLAAPRFNNVGGQVTVLILQNRGTAPVSGRTHFFTAGGALLATTPFDLAPRGTVALATATVPGLAGQSGTLTVAHDGGYGVVTGKAVALDPATGAGFDTPLSPRAR